jgi:hypothetical protein
MPKGVWRMSSSSPTVGRRIAGMANLAKAARSSSTWPKAVTIAPAQNAARGGSASRAGTISSQTKLPPISHSSSHSEGLIARIPARSIGGNWCARLAGVQGLTSGESV